MTLRAVAVAVAGLGLVIAAYLVHVHYSGGEPACAIAHGCAVVQSSRYATLAGVPVALLGLLGYGAAGRALARREAAALVVFTGAGFSGWLTYVEAAILDAVCIWCVAAAVCMVLLAVLSGIRLVDPRPGRSP